jgi:hypothetical protein
MTASDYADSLRAVLSTTDDDVRRRLALISDAAEEGAIDLVVLEDPRELTDVTPAG